MISAVIYARFSSHRQREESIEGQVRACREYAAAKNMNIIEVYADRAVSGRTDDRPEFQRMIADARQKRFSVVLVWKGDRIARNRQDKAHYRKKLKEHGIIIRSVTEAIPNTPEGIILESVLDGMDEYYSASLSINTKRGMRENALKAKHNGGKVPFGFLLDDEKRYIADPEHSLIVPEIFDAFLGNTPMSEIMRALENRGIRHNGRSFNYNNLRNLLRNRKYTGLYQFDDVIVEGGCPQLVSEEVFEMAQKRLRKYVQKQTPKSDVNFQLTGRLFCGKCSAAMAGDSGTSRNGKRHYYYSCLEKKNRRNCTMPSYRKEEVENLVEQVARVVLEDPKLVDDIASAIVRYQAEKPEAATIRSLEARIKSIDQQLANASSYIMQHGAFETLSEQVRELEAERKKLHYNIMEIKVDDEIVTKDQILFWINRFWRRRVDSEDFQQLLFETFINSVILDTDKVAVVFNYTDEKKEKVTFIHENDLSPIATRVFELASTGSPKTSELELYIFSGALVAMVSLQPR